MSVTRRGREAQPVYPRSARESEADEGLATDVPIEGLWARVLREANEAAEALKKAPDPKQGSGWDVVRRRYLAELTEATGRPVVAYATAFTDPTSPKVSADISIHPGDKEGFIEVTRDLPAGPLDVVLHSPGGSAEGAEGIVRLLRARFTDIRFIVPIAAKSAATMLAMSGSQIAMSEASELGPIDPQRQWRRQLGAMNELVTAPVWAMQQLWNRMQKEIADDPSSLPKWYPILSQFGPSLLIECETAMELARSLTADWLAGGMFKDDPDASSKAAVVVDALADHGRWKSHARMIGIDDLQALGVKLLDLREPTNEALARQVSLAWYSLSLTLANTGAVKIFANSAGVALFIVMSQTITVGPSVAAPSSPGARPGPRVPSPAAGTFRDASRRRKRKR